MRTLLPLFTLAAIAGCTVGPQTAPAPDLRGQARLAEMLAGRVPGAPERCLPNSRTADMIPIDANHIAYRDGSTLYVSTMTGACGGIGFGYALVTKPFGFSGPCRDDFAYAVDTSSGMTMGSCTFGDFIPYRVPR